MPTARVRMGTEAARGPDHGVEVGTFRVLPDVAALARAVGADAVVVTEPEELSAAFSRALSSDRPCVVDVRVDLIARPPMDDRIEGLHRTPGG